jgi:hypothetical protein
MWYVEDISFQFRFLFDESIAAAADDILKTGIACVVLVDGGYLCISHASKGHGVLLLTLQSLILRQEVITDKTLWKCANN